MPLHDLAPDFEPVLGPAVRAARARHWRRTRRLTAALLLVWFLVGFVVTWFARDLDFPFFGWPFSFWVAAQGGVVVFVVLLTIYARRMALNDQRLANDDGPDADDSAEASH
jgi:putative solute:sodium symporter small subunit